MYKLNSIVSMILSMNVEIKFTMILYGISSVEDIGSIDHSTHGPKIDPVQ